MGTAPDNLNSIMPQSLTRKLDAYPALLKAVRAEIDKGHLNQLSAISPKSQRKWLSNPN